jgi:aminocarboxymuconate-semialdehyde decarboxylase
VPATPLKIDIHTHILPERWPDLRERYREGDWVQIEHTQSGCARLIKDDSCFREVQANCWDPHVRLAECDESGVHVQVLSTVPVMFSYGQKAEHALDLARLLNDHIAEVCRRSPDRFVGLGTVPLQAPPLAVKEMERCVGELRLAGIEIGTHINGWNLDEPALFEFFSAAAALGAAIFVHPWEMLGCQRMPRSSSTPGRCSAASV